MRGSWISVAAVAAAGCVASGGTRVGEAELSRLVRGETRYEQVVAALGRPSVATAAPSGERILIYKSERLRVRASTLIPLVGSMLGGTDEKNAWVTLFFDRAGVLTDWTVERQDRVHRAF